MTDVLFELEPEDLAQLRAQIAQLDALPDALADAEVDESAAAATGFHGGVGDAACFAYRYSFALAAGTSAGSFWETLKLKAAEAHRFVDVIEQCTVVERTALGLVRDIVVRGVGADWMSSGWDGPPAGVEVRATERVFVDEEARTVLYRERTDRFVCMNALVVQEGGRFAMKGTYIYPVKRSRAAFLETNARLFAQLEKHASAAE
jgi:hypothetical protein